MNRYLIINADDFGFAEGVNEAILEAHTKGVLTSTTLMANMPSFEHAVSLVKQCPTLGVGVHLNIFRGKPLSEPTKIRSLLNPKTGLFWADANKFLRSLWAGHIRDDHVYAELKEQIQRCIDDGIRPTHFDSEKHLHMFSQIMNVVIQLAKEFNVASIRCVKENVFAHLPSFLGYFRKPKLYAWPVLGPVFGNSSRRLRQSGVYTNDHFFGLMDTGNMIAKTYCRILNQLPEGITEIMSHPGKGFVSDGTRDLPLSISRSWRDEFQALIHSDVKSWVQQNKIQLIHWGDVPTCAGRRDRKGDAAPSEQKSPLPV